jgi:hypothetical protein
MRQLGAFRRTNKPVVVTPDLCLEPPLRLRNEPKEH